ncbi:hypothetical protein Gohar_004045 [Gossypium harknessii]|uniref:Reverse transcriptase Ty1/copia-type domain-containing protein n=1 Tax=Gossypium harknessii TaxID=34285 RepID=A0A7J9H3V8_9ROSI|nr:hypothetical protein [Gossypium harknessii]
MSQDVAKKYSLGGYTIDGNKPTSGSPMCQKEKLSKEDEVEKIDETFYRSLVGCLMYLMTTRPEVVNTDVKLAPLRDNATVAQIKHHSDEQAKTYKAMSCIQNDILDVIFMRIMACEIPNEVWNKLKEEF